MLYDRYARESIILHALMELRDGTTEEWKVVQGLVEVTIIARRLPIFSESIMATEKTRYSKAGEKQLSAYAKLTEYCQGAYGSERDLTSRSMGGKAKFKKHTAAELERRQKQVNKGGGKAGAATRGVAKLNFTATLNYFMPGNQSASPDIKSHELHYSSKHPKATFDREAIIKKAEALRDSQQDHSGTGSHHKKK
ncbi:hypothetical protein PsorP6_017873 [Peronosclerospora sorghi]|uniref:Uncharacterized protein n=1 Tax=Peronosclerospora sorghi TaxID=230839 RepID=A0ACC0WE82_9STRA|nr:hypothetical protein PsorP6_017873 [Peronosclerospora sorghi]